MGRKTTNLLAGLPNEVVIHSCRDLGSADELFITFPNPEAVCPDCGSVACNRKGIIPFRVRHAACMRRSVILSFSCIRYRCRECGRTFTAKPYWLHDKLRMTDDLYRLILLDLTELLSMSAVARHNCVPVSAVQSVLSNASCPKPSRLPHTLCIDEFKGDSGIWSPKKKKWNHIKYQCSVADGEAGIITDILPDSHSDTLNAYFREYTDMELSRVKFFCCDMHNGYTSLAKRLFPDAVICIDLFHVVNRLNEAVDNVRRQIQNNLLERNDTEHYKCLKHSAYILKTAKANQKELWKASYDRRMERLFAALSVSDSLKEAYGMLQDFHDILNAPAYSDRREMLGKWIIKYLPSDVSEVMSAANMVKHWRGYIQNSFKYGKSNGPCEGLNNKIKVLKRISFGMHDFESFRKRILLSCGSTHWPADTSKYAMTNVRKAGV